MSQLQSRLPALCLMAVLACGGGSEPGDPARTSPDAAVDLRDGGLADASIGAADAALSGADADVPRDAGEASVAAPRDGGAADAAPGSSGGDSGQASGEDTQSSADALRQLETYLATARAARPALAMQPFARVALVRADAERAQKLLWEDFAAGVRETRKDEVGATESVAKTIKGTTGLSLRYYLARRGVAPEGGRSLFISMHGGGEAPAATNDSQWRNQISLVTGYDPKDAIWVAPRAPVDAWNMWFVEGIDALFERLITAMIVFEGVNPNKVYLNGYSAGGDGVYQLGPRMGERWAGAGMSAGHPNASSPLSLRNLAFAIHVGGNDTAFDRNKKGEEVGKRLEQLASADPGGYVNQWQVHAGKPHWMDLEDKVSIPFLQSHVRNPLPKKIVWEQAEIARAHFYWLAVDAADQKPKAELRVSYEGDRVRIELAKDVHKLRIRLTDQMLDLSAPVSVEYGGKVVFSGRVQRTIGLLALTLAEREDPSMMFPSELGVEL